MAGFRRPIGFDLDVDQTRLDDTIGGNFGFADRLQGGGLLGGMGNLGTAVIANPTPGAIIDDVALEEVAGDEDLR
jgi:hypothetical protein